MLGYATERILSLMLRKLHTLPMIMLLKCNIQLKITACANLKPLSAVKVIYWCTYSVICHEQTKLA